MSPPPPLSMEALRRSISDVSSDVITESDAVTGNPPLAAIPEIEDAKCECCGMCEECTPEYIRNVRSKFEGRLVCGLCSEAVKEEMAKNGGKRLEAVREHMSECLRFNSYGRSHPVLFQAQAMREILKKSKSFSPREEVKKKIGGGISRTSSCIPAITGVFDDRKMVN